MYESHRNIDYRNDIGERQPCERTAATATQRGGRNCLSSLVEDNPGKPAFGEAARAGHAGYEMSSSGGAWEAECASGGWPMQAW